MFAGGGGGACWNWDGGFMTNLVSSIHLVWGLKAPFVIIYILVCNALLVVLTMVGFLGVMSKFCGLQLQLFAAVCKRWQYYFLNSSHYEI